MKRSAQAGISLFELLAAITLLAIVSMGIARNMIVSMRSTNQTVRTAIARELAVQKLEAFVAMDPEFLSDANDETETLSVNGVDYLRETEVTVDTDRSRTVDVTVTSQGREMVARSRVSTSFALWGKR